MSTGHIDSLDLHHVAAEGIVRAEAIVIVEGEKYSGKAEEVDIADAAVAAFVAAVNQGLTVTTSARTNTSTLTAS